MGTSDAPLRWRRPHGWVALALGLGALVAAGVIAVVAQRQAAVRFTVTAGPPGTTRIRIAQALLDAARRRGAEATLVSAANAVDELAQVNAGRIDFALFSGAFHLGAHEHLREVTPLYLEALHLAVREELADAVTHDLGALRGRSVDLGPRDSETEDLARTVLAFADLSGDAAGATPVRTMNVEYDALRARFAAGDLAALPDAVFQLSVVPSQLVVPFVREAGYRLVSLPFADAMRLNALIGASPNAGDVDWHYVTDVTVPAFTYATRPPVPAAPLATVGSRLLLVAHEHVPDETVRLVLESVFRSRFARIAEPLLDPSVLALPPRLPLHPATVDYLRRNQPLITSDSVDKMSNLLSILGALVGGALFLFQWRRQRTAAQRDELFGSYLLRVASIEQRVTSLELAATLDLQQLIVLQREVLQVKTEALERFAAGDLGSQTSLSDLLAPLDGARDHIGELLLHVRDTLETKAESEGRSEQAVWREAVKASGEPPPKT